MGTAAVGVEISAFTNCAAGETTNCAGDKLTGSGELLESNVSFNTDIDVNDE